MKFIKPQKLNRGDVIGIISPSWGGPAAFPHIYEEGIRVLKEELGFQIKEFPNTRASADFLYKNPKARADDFNSAFKDPEVKGIIASIGGEDSVRILPYLDRETIINNPKFLMGYSDTTTLLTYCNQLGLVTFNGPSVMAGFAQWKSFDESFKEHIKLFLISDYSNYEYKPFPQWSDGYLDWSKLENVGKVKPSRINDGWRFIQGNSVAHGELFGGCIEVLEFMKGTDFWPKPDFWKGKILFFETSEEKPSIDSVKWMLRNYGVQGIYDKISGIIFGRARDYSDEEKEKLDKTIISVVNEEFGKTNLPIVTNMDFGHTDPQFILPLGFPAEINCKDKTFQLLS